MEKLELIQKRLIEKIEEQAKLFPDASWKTEMLALIAELSSEIKNEVKKHGKESKR